MFCDHRSNPLVPMRFVSSLQVAQVVPQVRESLWATGRTPPANVVKMVSADHLPCLISDVVIKVHKVGKR